MANGWLDPHPSIATEVVACLAFAVTAGLAARAPRGYRRLVVARERGEHAVVRRRYRRAWAVQAARVVLVLALVAADPKLTRADVGLRWPSGPDVSRSVGWTVYGLFVVGLGVVLMRVRVRRGRSVPGQRMFAALVARDGERWAAAGVAVGAGVSEELLFRGLFLGVAMHLLGIGAGAAILLTSVLFGLLHAYQGWLGVLGTALVGLLLAYVYYDSRSLLLPVLLHVAIDLRALVLVPLQPVTAERRH